MTPSRATTKRTLLADTRGFRRESLRALIASRHEPAWMRKQRQEAWRVLESTPFPQTTDEPWRRTDIKAMPIDQFSPVAKSPSAAGALKSIPADWRHALKAKEISGALIAADGRVVGRTASKQVKSSGVIFTDMDTALRDHSKLLQPYFLTEAVRIEDDYFAALHGAFWQGGTFLYVPRGVELSLPLRSFTWLGQRDVSAAHTLVVMEPGSRAVLIDE